MFMFFPWVPPHPFCLLSSVSTGRCACPKTAMELSLHGGVFTPHGGDGGGCGCGGRGGGSTPMAVAREWGPSPISAEHVAGGWAEPIVAT